MKFNLRLLFPLMLTGLFFSAQAQQNFELKYLSTHYTDVFDEGAAEIIAYDAQTSRIFFTNADANYVGVLDITNPLTPTLVDSINLNTYGGGVNSVAVSNGLLAVAVEADPKQDPGSIVLFDTDGTFQKSFTVGALPDMVTFNAAGTKIISANEGEPNDDYTIDPMGTVSIIDLATDNVLTLNFEAWNGKKAYLQNRGVRIFGPNASVAQDLEPEYVTVAPNDSIAYVSLQENNALAVVNINAGTIMDVLPLGYKDHMSGTPSLTEFKLNEIPGWPSLGAPVYNGGQDSVMLGGFSGLYYDANESTAEKMVFYTIPDRGPNDSPVNKSVALDGPTQQDNAPTNLRPFKLPNYQARIVKVTIDMTTGMASLDEQIMLNREKADGELQPISGRGNVFGFDEIPVTYSDAGTPYQAQDWVDTSKNVFYTELPHDLYGGDFEGILRDKDGNFWMCDEYRPAIYKFDDAGLLIERYVPDGTSAKNIIIDLGPGTYGAETLPAVYNTRRANRGFEAIAYDADNDLIYAFIQSPMYNPNSGTKNKSDIIRILGVNAADGTPAAEYIYLLDRNRESGFGPSRVDKMGDAVYTGNGKFMVLERDSGTPASGPTSQKYVYEIDITNATNLYSNETLLALSTKMDTTGADDKTLEMMTADDLAAAGIRPVTKRKVLNLPSIGYLPSDKAEGLALLPNGIAVLNDNDFGLAGAGVSDESNLGIITFGDNYSIDASNRDDAINITAHPVLGMFQPDAIASYESNGATYIVTANEGDARDYDGYSEEERVGGLTLDPTAFPEASMIQDDANTGRLNSTTANGDTDGDGDIDVIYSYGARSFSILDAYANLVYDSGNDFESYLANDDAYSAEFNSNNDENGSFDARSDDKGPEPEAVTIAEYDGMTLAFIGLERMGGIMVYDITDPTAPQFLSYTNNRNFSADAETREGGDLGPEDIIFIPASDSPVNEPLIVVANEVSGTVSFFSPADIVDVDDVIAANDNWTLYPNPSRGLVQSTKTSDYQVFDVVGQLVRRVSASNRINLEGLPAGTYFVKDLQTQLAKIVTKQ